MPKRKRGEPNLGDKLEKHCNDVSKALKAAKGLERQRYSKRLHEDGVEPDKKERLEREVTVLKVSFGLSHHPNYPFLTNYLVS
jgi:hypothetical protein